MKYKILTQEKVRKLLPLRSRDAHKGRFGHILILAGSRGMTGAAILCSKGALRCGAGLVTVGLPESQQPVVARRIAPEAMTLPLSETSAGTLSIAALDKICDFIIRRKITTLAIGPGLSTVPETVELVKKLLHHLTLPIVLDADGINALSKVKSKKFKPKNFIVDELKHSKARIIITPHPGELSRLMNIPVSVIQNKRLLIARKFASLNNVICVLKGYRTVITDGKETYINLTGNPGMATGGSGDVLTGMISAFIGQVNNLFSAAQLGVYIHGLSGDLACADKGEISMLPTDMIRKISSAIKLIHKSSYDKS